MCFHFEYNSAMHYPLFTLLHLPTIPTFPVRKKTRNKKKKEKKKKTFDICKGLSQCEYNTTAWRCLINKLIRLSSSPFTFVKKSRKRKKNDTTLVLKPTSMCPMLRFSSSIRSVRPTAWYPSGEVCLILNRFIELCLKIRA